MPGPGTHVLVSDQVVPRLAGFKRWPYASKQPGPNSVLPNALADIAKRHRNYYALGAVGLDMFFFLPDFRNHLGSPLIGVVHFLDDLYAKLDSWILEDWERYFGPGSENTTEAVSQLTGDLSTVVSDIMGRFSSLLINAILDLGAEAHDWFGLFSLGLNVGYDDQDFFWSDMLHYRKTSRFAHSLWSIAGEWASREGDDALLWSERLQAYALGYMTHVATDITGHAFVNEKCSGPFRTHWQRHHLIENHIDAKTYDDLHGADLNYNRRRRDAPCHRAGELHRVRRLQLRVGAGGTVRAGDAQRPCGADAGCVPADPLGWLVHGCATSTDPYINSLRFVEQTSVRAE